MIDVVDLSRELADGVDEILKKYGMHSNLQRSMCALDISTLISGIVDKVSKSKKNENEMT